MLYNETTTTIYKRANYIVVNNDLGVEPEITFHEQYATVGGEAVDGRVGSCGLVMPADVTEEFALVHPETGEVVGSTSFLNLQVILHSLYLHTAGLRDTPPVEVEPTEVIEPTEEETTDGSN